MNYPNPYPSNPGCYPAYPTQQKGITTVAIVPAESVDSYPVAAGTTAVLFDFDKMMFWLKATDVYGRPLPVEPYFFNKVVQQQTTQTQAPQPAPQNQNGYVAREDYEKLVTAVSEQGAMLAELYKELKG